MRYYIIIFLLLSGSLLSYAQEWEVPEERNNRLSSFEFTEASVSAGEDIYVFNCKSCHGDPGKGNYQALNPIPGDPATEKFQLNSDGALQFKISEGRGLMPSFKRILSQDDIWNVIAYIRSYNPDYTQVLGTVSKLTNVKWSEIKIMLELDKEEHTLLTRLIGLEGDQWTPVPGTEVRLLAARYFGTMILDEPKISDDNGSLSFSLPADLPGDGEGGVKLNVSLTDVDLFGDISKDTTLMLGSAVTAPPLTDKRAMWNTNRKAPLWLIFSYFGVVLTVWGFIFYVLFRLRAIHKEGEDEE